MPPLPHTSYQNMIVIVIVVKVIIALIITILTVAVETMPTSEEVTTGNMSVQLSRTDVWGGGHYIMSKYNKYSHGGSDEDNDDGVNLM